MRRALRAYHDALDRGEDFDFVVDTGSKIDGYRNVTRLAEEMEKTR